MYRKSQSPSWNIYVLHRAEVLTLGSVLDLLQVSDIKEHSALWKRQGLNLSSSVISAEKPISSSPSLDRLISLCLGSDGLAGTWTLVSHCTIAWDTGALCQILKGQFLSLSLLRGHVVKAITCAGTSSNLKIPKLCLNIIWNFIFWRSHIKIWLCKLQWIFTEHVHNKHLHGSKYSALLIPLTLHL